MNTELLLFMVIGLLVALLVIGAWIAFYWAGKEKETRKALEEKYALLERKWNSVELETIQYKLNPHLFKNTLNAIQSHAYQTYYALDKLANVLDYILYESENPFVTLKEEVEFALSLIEINRLKVSPLFDLRVKSKIDAEHPLYHQKLIAPLITIDLIENAFKHADLQNGDAFIAIVFELKDDHFALTVSNKISGKPPLKKERSGFGRESLKKRLDILYKGNYTLDQFVEENVYISHLKIQLLEHKNQMLAAGR
jgi:LytS/YehU family sensor histidine kinase